MTVVFGALTLLFTPNFPEKAQSWFLKWNERERLIALLEESRGKEAGNSGELQHDTPMWRILVDWRIHLFTMCFFCCDITASSVSAFAPTILTELGYASTTAQLMSMPIWASGIVASFTVTIIATRFNSRWACVLLSICLQIAGWSIMKVYPPQPGVRYLGLFLMSMGTFPQMPLLMAWLSSNLRGRKHLAVGMAWQVGFGNCANFVSANVFIRGERPRYPTGITVGLSFTCVGFALVTLATALLVILNRRRVLRLSRLEGERRTLEESRSFKYLL
jgi:cyanate permease